MGDDAVYEQEELEVVASGDRAAGSRPAEGQGGDAATTPATTAATTAGGPVVGDDGLARCPWAARDPLLRAYHDEEWGVAVADERGLYERVVLEAFQAGLSWRTVLAKRPAFRAAFAGLDPERVAAFTEARLDAVLADPGVVRNRAKVYAARTNAVATLALRPSGGLPALVAAHRPAAPFAPATTADMPTRTPESEALAGALRAAGFVFVGPTTAWALMEAVGLVDPHLLGCHRRGASPGWPDGWERPGAPPGQGAAERTRSGADGTPTGAERTPTGADGPRTARRRPGAGGAAAGTGPRRRPAPAPRPPTVPPPSRAGGLPGAAGTPGPEDPDEYPLTVDGQRVPWRPSERPRLTESDLRRILDGDPERPGIGGHRYGTVPVRTWTSRGRTAGGAPAVDPPGLAGPQALIGELLGFAEERFPAGTMRSAQDELDANEWYLALHYALFQLEEAGLLPPLPLLAALREGMACAYPDRRFDDLDVRDQLDRAWHRANP